MQCRWHTYRTQLDACTIGLGTQNKAWQVLAEASFFLWLCRLRSRLNLVRPISQRLPPVQPSVLWWQLWHRVLLMVTQRFRAYLRRLAALGIQAQPLLEHRGVARMEQGRREWCRYKTTWRRCKAWHAQAQDVFKRTLLRVDQCATWSIGRTPTDCRVTGLFRQLAKLGSCEGVEA